MQDGGVGDLQVEVCVEPQQSPLSAHRLVVEAAVSFLESQRTLLRHGLDHAADDEMVELVTDRHDASHEAWVSTVAALRTHVPDDVTERVIELYGFHGRVAGGLAGERSMRLEGPIETGVRRILADQLDRMTEQVIDLLESTLAR